MEDVCVWCDCSLLISQLTTWLCVCAESCYFEVVHACNKLRMCQSTCRLKSTPSGVCGLSRSLCSHVYMKLRMRDDVHSMCWLPNSCILSGLRAAVAEGLTQRVQGTSAFLFGWADTPLQRGLAQRRKEMGWFKKRPDMQAIRPDVGPQPQKQYGLTGELDPGRGLTRTDSYV